MILLRQRILFLLIVLLSSHHRLFPQSLYSLQTSDLRLVYYDKANEYVVPHTARCFLNAYNFHRRLFQYGSSEKVTIFVQDLRDFGNAGALTVPRNLVSLSIAPSSYAYETSPANERINSTINHELVHIVTMDEAAGSDKFFRSLFFGKVAPITDNPLTIPYRYLTSPRWHSPRWYIEGIAVFLETWMAGGLGRALGAYDEMVFRTLVHDDSRIYDVIGLEAEGTALDFQAGATSYLYGTRFMSYLAYRYGPQKLIEWTSRREGSDAYFASQFRHVYGVSLDSVWSGWIRFEREWQRMNLDTIRANPVTAYRPLTDRALGSVSRGYYDDAKRTLYAAIRYPGQVASVAAININDGSIETICDVKGAALYYVCSLTYDPSTEALFYTTDNNDWRDLNVVDLRTGKSGMLMEDVRIGDLAFNTQDRSIWGVRHYNGISTIVRIPPPYTQWNQVYSLPYGSDVFDLDVSHDGRLLSAGIADVTGRQKLIAMEIEKLLNGDPSQELLFDFEFSTPSNFTFSSDDRYLYGSSYYTGVSNIYRYEFATKTMEVMSNCETGFFRPQQVSKDSLIVFVYTSKGFLPAMIAIQPQERVNAIKYFGEEVQERHPVVTTWKVDPPSPERVNLDSLILYSGDYVPWQHLSLASAYPIVEGYKDFAAFGVRFNFSDPVLLYNLDVTTSYTPNRALPMNERLHAAFNYRFWDWRISGTYNGASFYDLFGPTKTSRKGYSLGVHYKKYLVYDDPRTFQYSVSLTGYGGLERLPDFQNVAVAFDKLLAFKTGLDYKYFEKSIGAVDDEKGIQWQLIFRTNYANSRFSPRLHTNLDYGVALPLDHSSIWLRNSVGYSFGDRGDPFATFFFGGFGNNWVDYQEVKRYREDYSFPGVEINEVGGKAYLKSMVEWTLPPLRFRRLGFYQLYSNWARIALFSSAIVADVEHTASRRRVLNAGGQVDFRIAILSSLESTLSFGYAVAFEKERPTDKRDHWTNEFMVSLKLLK